LWHARAAAERARLDNRKLLEVVRSLHAHVVSLDQSNAKLQATIEALRTDSDSTQVTMLGLRNRLAAEEDAREKIQSSASVLRWELERHTGDTAQVLQLQAQEARLRSHHAVYVSRLQNEIQKLRQDIDGVYSKEDGLNSRISSLEKQLAASRQEEEIQRKRAVFSEGLVSLKEEGRDTKNETIRDLEVQLRVCKAEHSGCGKILDELVSLKANLRDDSEILARTQSELEEEKLANKQLRQAHAPCAATLAGVTEKFNALQALHSTKCREVNTELKALKSEHRALQDTHTMCGRSETQWEQDFKQLLDSFKRTEMRNVKAGERAKSLRSMMKHAQETMDQVFNEQKRRRNKCLHARMLLSVLTPCVGFDVRASEKTDGVLVKSVSSDEDSGISKGYLLQSINGHPVADVSSFKSLIASSVLGDKVAVQVKAVKGEGAYTFMVLVKPAEKQISANQLAIIKRLALRDDDDFTIDLSSCAELLMDEEHLKIARASISKQTEERKRLKAAV